jgi:hypothetical protein
MRSYGITNAAPYASAPAIGAAGAIYWNTAESALYGSDGGAWNKLGPGAGGAPSGAAGGDLLGSSYPNPLVAAGAITRAKLEGTLASGIPAQAQIPQYVGRVSTVDDAGNAVWAKLPWTVAGSTLTPTDATQVVTLKNTASNSQLTIGARTIKARMVLFNPATPDGNFQIRVNGTATATEALDDITKPGWSLAMDAGVDNFSIYRAPATGGVPAWAQFLSIASDGKFTATVPTGDANAFHIKGAAGGFTNLILDTPGRAGIWFGDSTQGNARYFVGHESAGGSTAPWRVYAAGGGSRIAVWPTGQVVIGTAASGSNAIGGNAAYELIVRGDAGVEGGNLDVYSGNCTNQTATGGTGWWVANANVGLGWYAAGHGGLYNTSTGIWFHLLRASDSYQWINYGAGVGATIFDTARSETIAAGQRHSLNAFAAGTYNLTGAHYYVVGWPDSGPGRVNFYLPVSSSCVGRIYYFIQWGTAADVVVWPTGGDTISGATYVQLNAHRAKTILLAMNFGDQWFKLL